MLRANCFDILLILLKYSVSLPKSTRSLGSSFAIGRSEALEPLTNPSSSGLYTQEYMKSSYKVSKSSLSSFAVL